MNLLMDGGFTKMPTIHIPDSDDKRNKSYFFYQFYCSVRSLYLLEIVSCTFEHIHCSIVRSH